jgi:hypothetical protein
MDASDATLNILGRKDPLGPRANRDSGNAEGGRGLSIEWVRSRDRPEGVSSALLISIPSFHFVDR